MGFEPGILIGTRSADHIRASGHVPRKQAGHMTCTRPQAERQNPLATRAPSTHDPHCLTENVTEQPAPVAGVLMAVLVGRADGGTDQYGGAA
jgi:hypothetical protein